MGEENVRLLDLATIFAEPTFRREQFLLCLIKIIIA